MADQEFDELDLDLPTPAQPAVPQASPSTAPNDMIAVAGDLELPAHWGLDQANLENVRKVRGIMNLKHGLLANVPMICKAHRCPFVESCYIPPQDRRVGMRCPIEIAAIIERFERYCKALNITEEDVVDMQLVKDLVDLEIQMTRAEMKLAQNGGEFIDMVIAAVDQQGNPHYKPELHKAVEYKRELRKEHHRILQLLNSTRKDRERSNPAAANDAAVAASQLVQKFRELQASGQIRQVIEIVTPAQKEPFEEAVSNDGQAVPNNTAPGG